MTNDITNTKTRKSIQRPLSILAYGLSEEQLLLIQKNLPSNRMRVINCDCFTDLIAFAYIAAIINPDCLTGEDITCFNEYFNDVGVYSEKIIFTKQHSLLNVLSKTVKCTVFQGDFEFENKIRYVLLDAVRVEKRLNSYSDTIAQTIRVLSEIRNHPYITTAELAEKIERNVRTVQRYITTLICAGEFIEYDHKKKGWALFENQSMLFGDYKK